MIKISNKSSDFSIYSCQPTTKNELINIIDDRISKEGPKCNLNDINVSLIDDMSYLFAHSKFNGDIFKWNTSNVKSMGCMFYDSKFNGDISEWDVYKVENIGWMFYNSNFNQDISKWKIKDNCDIRHIFYSCPIRDEYKPKALQK